MTVVQFPPRSAGPVRPRHPESTILAALDVGSTKVCCLIAEVIKAKTRGPGEGQQRILKVLGFGHHGARGMRAGAVVDIEEAERSIRLAVDGAERMAGLSISDVHVSVAGGRPQCVAYSGSTRVASSEVGGADMQRAIENAMLSLNPGNRALLHASPVQYHLDDARGVKSPVGMFGEMLKVDINAVYAETGAMRNLGLAIARCHLNPVSYVLAPYAGARSVLVRDEMALGATYIEMGGATTSVAVYHQNRLCFADVVPLGGQHITNDIARGLSTPIAHAERLKTLHGSAIPSQSDEREHVAVPLVGERGVDTIHSVPRSMLTGIIRPRLEETFEMIRDQLEASPFAAMAGRRLVLSGGASQLPGVRELAGQILDRHVRLGTPTPLKGMPEAAMKPAFAVAAGLLDHALNPDAQILLPERRHAHAARREGYISRVGQWIMESF